MAPSAAVPLVRAPRPESVTLPVALQEFPEQQLKAYGRESCIAEKLETIYRLGLANSHM